MHAEGSVMVGEGVVQAIKLVKSKSLNKKKSITFQTC